MAEYAEESLTLMWRQFIRRRFPAWVEWAHTFRQWPLRQRSPAVTFTDIYRHNRWGDQESRSGPGSTLARTERLRRELLTLWHDLAVHSLLDIPCGDFNWMRMVVMPVAEYIGMDIVADLIEHNIHQFSAPHRTFICADLTCDPLPSVDIILCRDGLVHLSHAHIKRALANIQRSHSTYLAATTFTGTTRNRQIVTGDWRPLNLQAAPFYFPEPLRSVNDSRLDGTYADKTLGVWRIADLPVLSNTP